MNFREFEALNPNKREGTIDPNGNIRYGNIADASHIHFKRINLDGSLKPSYWDITFPEVYHDCYTEKEKEKLKVWAQNMPEFGNEMVHIYDIPRCKIRDLQ